MSLDIDGFSYTVRRLEEGRVELRIIAPDGKRYTETGWIDIDTSVHSSEWCLEREVFESSTSDPSSPSVTVPPCTLWAPIVVWGQAIDPIEYVCVVQYYPAGFGFPSFVEIGPSGLLLQSAPTGVSYMSWGHHYSATGEIVGRPPYDAPSPHIYQACSDLAPWDTGKTGPSEAFFVEGDLVYRVDAPEEITGLWMRFTFEPGGEAVYRDGERVSTSIQYLHYPSVPTLRVSGATQELAPIPPVPDRTGQWNLAITVRSGAVAKTAGKQQVEPTRIDFNWEPNSD